MRVLLLLLMLLLHFAIFFLTLNNDFQQSLYYVFSVLLVLLLFSVYLLSLQKFPEAFLGRHLWGLSSRGPSDSCGTLANRG